MSLSLIFLWANRVYFTATLVMGLQHWRRATDQREYNDGQAKSLVSAWQIIGTFIFAAKGMSAFHLIWWYALGWIVYSIYFQISLVIRR